MAKKFVSQPSKVSARSAGPDEPPVKKRKSPCKRGEIHYWLIDRLGAGQCKHCGRKKEFDIRPAGTYHPETPAYGKLRTSTFGALHSNREKKMREEEA